MATIDNPSLCKNCEQTLVGKYCHFCGEKVVEEKDFYFKTLLKESVDGIFNLDSKVFKSFYYLIFKPGELTVNYVEGIRKPFMKPIQLFLLINVLFFLFLTQADILRIPAEYYFRNDNQTALNQMSEQVGISELELKHQYDSNTTNFSKAAIIVLIPFFALILLMVNYKKQIAFGKHMIFALHYFSFFLVFCVLLIVVSKLGNVVLQISIVAVNFLYLFFAIKKFYKNNMFFSALKAFSILVLFLTLILLYRQLISDVTFKLMP
ncbi:DUF3667 domain-containing protein [Subsaxibacter sp. CAU 1640]|uniref:DUF3667 domain-containing protein n=1 Tax=Subsaxibacter sp. CAU 1640 TaxID=2933271 RepID=UPI0020052B77|nr:DUF3667 domain-containing protein [Subsaxibacter sp. CAU 1640]MCK7589116.1 DUF3667 domain-containing protein [Subsaxibacter sp. CAU 1640]